MASSMASDFKVLILGGTGFVGRNLVDYLVRQDLAKKIRVADKVPPQMAWLNAKHSESFSSDKVEFKQANLIHEGNVERVFAVDEEGNEFDFVINLAAETKYGQTEPVYMEGIQRLSLNCAQAAARHKVKVFVELSTAQVYAGDKKANTEESPLEPWTSLAKHKVKVEKNLANLASELNYVILRPAIIYGLGDRAGLTPRIVIGSIYRYTQQKMQLLWTKDLQMNTVHVDDVCRAIWHICLHGNRYHGHIFNLADKGHTSQGHVTSLISQMFGIGYDFLGSVLSNLARVRMAEVVEDINERHMTPWSDACRRDGVTNTPLTPFIDQELLYNKHVNVDGTKLESTGFTYSVPSLSVDTLERILEDYTKLGLLPPSLALTDCFYSGNDIDALDLGGDGDGLDISREEAAAT